MIVPKKAVGPSDVADHYDELDPYYLDVWGEHMHHGLWLSGIESQETAVRQLVFHVAQLARIKGGSKVCDIGCGYGATVRLLSGTFRAEVTGITLSRAQFEYAASKSGHETGVSYLLGDWLENELPTGGFDAAIAIESTEHMADKAGCFSEGYRVLRPGGRLVICSWLAAERPRGWETNYLLEPICRQGRLPSMGAVSEYRELLEKSGFVVEQFQDLTPMVKRTWSICLRRMFANLWRDRRYRNYLLSRRSRNRGFTVTMFRIWVAYRTGAMRYGLFVTEKPRL